MRNQTHHPTPENFSRLRRPTLVAGETVPSFVRRAAVLSGYRSEFWAFKAQMGRQHRPLEAMPSPLAKLCDELQSDGATPDALLRQGHTLYGYWTCCANDNTRARVRSILIYGRPGPIRPCRLPVNLEPNPYDIFHCPECDERHLEELGCRPTLVVHQAPFVSLCPTHGCRLNEAQNRALFGSECICATSASSNLRSLEFAQRTQHLIENLTGGDDLVRGFKASMQERGFVTQCGRVRWQQFVKAHNAFHSEHLPDARLNTVCHDDELLRRTINGLMNDTGCPHPVLYCLLDWSLTEIACTSGQVVSATSNGRKPLPETLVRAAFDANRNATAAANSIGVSVNTFITRALELGLPVRLKPSLLAPSVRAEIGNLFKSGMSIPSIGTMLGVSVCSVYRALKAAGLRESDAELVRAARIAAVRKSLGVAAVMNRQLTITQLRKQNPALYARAYRADKRLILQYTNADVHTPANHAKPRKRRHMEAQARAAIRNLHARAKSNHFPRVSIHRVGFETGLSDFYLSSCGPKTKALLRVVVENEGEFVARRVAEAAVEFGGPQGYCERWKALRWAGLRMTRARLGRN
ncbi:TnsD family Tn7-like transposition protein [Paraburkholderia fungorum]|uniref:TnsD family Tn7-like transposition protein n=1 Tax=Paraburkholderia fungorum TaxID=134537 RepID=UPI0038B83C66